MKVQVIILRHFSLRARIWNIQNKEGKLKNKFLSCREITTQNSLSYQKNNDMIIYFYLYFTYNLTYSIHIMEM